MVRRRTTLFLLNTLSKLRFTNYSECTVLTRLQCERLDSLFKYGRVGILKNLLISWKSRLSFKMSAKTLMSLRRSEKKNWPKNIREPIESSWKKYLQLNPNSALTSQKKKVISEKQHQKSNDQEVQIYIPLTGPQTLPVTWTIFSKACSKFVQQL